MKFLSKNKVPSELPDLAMDDSDEGFAEENHSGDVVSESAVHPEVPTSMVRPEVPKPIIPRQSSISEPPKNKVRGEDYLEFRHPEEEEIKQKIGENLAEGENKYPQKNFFDQVLEDINGEIKDLGKIDDWYNNKFLPQDVVSNMRNYWEGNKADIIIQSFGEEYKRKINEKIRDLQELEGDWREIYFRMIKKEEEMKKEERALKELLSEFVNLCKGRKNGDNKKEESEEKTETSPNDEKEKKKDEKED